jgi:hypothetical protein
MEANIIFDNVKAYNVVKWDVALGQTFKVELVDIPGILRWFTDNDPVLKVDVEENGGGATLTTTQKGECEIQLQHQGGLVKVLQVSVYDNVAVALNASATTPILK